jgi:hypothetical protein
MVPMIRAAFDPELDCAGPAMLSGFVVEQEPDAYVPDGELTWWLQRQEQAKTRAALAVAGLL